MAKLDLDSPQLYINRELSWLEFNDRVLREGLSDSVPMLERLKFLAIVGSNLDEFFMIRVAGLRRQEAAGIAIKDPSGLTPAEQLAAVRQRAARMVKEQYEGIGLVLGKLAQSGISLLSFAQTTEEQKQFLASLFASEILPALTPLAVEELSPCPILPGLQLHLALRMSAAEADPAERRDTVVIVPVPRGLPRFLTLPAQSGLQMIALEDVIAHEVGVLFPGRTILARTVFRLTRDADMELQEDDPEDLIRAMEQAIRERGRRAAVRLEVGAGADETMRKWLIGWCEVGDQDLYEIAGPLDASALMDIATRPGFEKLKDPPWLPQEPRDLLGAEDLWQALRERDVLLLHPYEAFDPVVRLVEQAADDPNVLAIKQTLYRTSGDSPIVRALARAAEKGKQVTVLVELRARFDEAKNVTWARSLEDAGCYVLYGIAGFKTHVKALLVVRREAHRICRYVHLSTGNYNEKTARIYSDIGLMTSDSDLASDAAAFFNLLTGASQPVGWRKFVIAPTGLRDRLTALIEREIQTSTPETPGLILAKFNSLQDPKLIGSLYRASQAGVHIRLNVRGLCCLRPGVKGVSENIEVVSVVDRYLEHARVLYFRNGGHEEVYISSADWMVRNLDYRLELLFPITRKELKARLVATLNLYFADTVKGRRLGSDGEYKPVTAKGAAAARAAADGSSHAAGEGAGRAGETSGRAADEGAGRAGEASRRGGTVRAQERLYQEAVEAAKARQPVQEFRPLTRPAE